MTLLSQSVHERINLVSLLLIAFTLPFHILLCSYCIALFVLNQIAEGNLLNKLKASMKNKFALLFLSFFILHLISLGYSANIFNGLFEIEKKVSLFIFPLLIFPLALKKKGLSQIFISFVVACFILSLIFLGGAILNYVQSGDIESFLLNNLSATTGMHRVYASMYFLFSIYLVFNFRQSTDFNVSYKNALCSFLIIYFTIFIFLLASRMMLMLTVLSLLAMIIFVMVKTKKWLRGMVVFTLFLSLAGSFLILNDRVRTIMGETFKDLEKGNSKENFTGPNLRIEIWETSLQVIQKNPMGVGVGDAQDMLTSHYISADFTWGILNRFNAHNQYLQTLIELGFIGLLAFLLCLIWPVFVSLKNQEYLYPAFIVLFSLACLSESMLATQKGIVFYAFFNSLFAFHYPIKNS